MSKFELGHDIDACCQSWRRWKGWGQNAKKSKPVRGTHSLERVEIGNGQDAERKKASEGHSQTGEGGQDTGHRKKVSEQGALTCWRGQTLGLARTLKKEQAKGTFARGGNNRTGQMEGKEEEMTKKNEVVDVAILETESRWRWKVDRTDDDVSLQGCTWCFVCLGSVLDSTPTLPFVKGHFPCTHP